MIKILFSLKETYDKWKNLYKEGNSTKILEEAAENLGFMQRENGKQDDKDKKKRSRSKLIFSYYSLCFSVSSFYTYKVTYNDCLDLHDNSVFFINENYLVFLYISFYFELIAPLLLLYSYNRHNKNILKTA